jgi:hypothetical protein
LMGQPAAITRPPICRGNGRLGGIADARVDMANVGSRVEYMSLLPQGSAGHASPD